MTSSPAATASASAPGKDLLFQTITATEWGQVTGLEPHASYFIIRRPTKELTREKSEEFVSDFRAFLHTRREETEKQVRELNEKYGTTARARASELREQLEKRFDELTREFEQRVEKLESELSERADRLFQKGRQGDDAKPASGQGPETPGEMPHGEDAAPGPAPASASAGAGASPATEHASAAGPASDNGDAEGKASGAGRKKGARKD